MMSRASFLFVSWMRISPSQRESRYNVRIQRFDLGCVKEMIVWIRYDSKFDFRIRVEAKRPGDKYCKNDDSEIFI